jgi:hypothetical protein
MIDVDTSLSTAFLGGVLQKRLLTAFSPYTAGAKQLPKTSDSGNRHGMFSFGYLFVSLMSCDCYFSERVCFVFDFC